MATMRDCAGSKPQLRRTGDAFGAIEMAAPVSWSRADCSRIFVGMSARALVGRDFEKSIGTIEGGQTNRYCVSCSAQSDTSTETGDSGANDDDFHFSVLIELVLRLSQCCLARGCILYMRK